MGQIKAAYAQLSRVLVQNKTKQKTPPDPTFHTMQWDLSLDPPQSGKSHVFLTPFFTPPVCDAGFLLSICRLQVKAKITRPLQLFLFKKK